MKTKNQRSRFKAKRAHVTQRALVADASKLCAESEPTNILRECAFCGKEQMQVDLMGDCYFCGAVKGECRVCGEPTDVSYESHLCAHCDRQDSDDREDDARYEEMRERQLSDRCDRQVERDQEVRHGR